MVTLCFRNGCQLSADQSAQVLIGLHRGATGSDDVKERIDRLIGVQGKRSIESHRELGTVLLDKCGMSRSKEGLEDARAHIRGCEMILVRCHGSRSWWTHGSRIRKAARVADFRVW